MSVIEKYVNTNLVSELRIVQANSAHSAIPLTVFEKTLIYKYSDEGFRDTNKELRMSKGTNFDEFGLLLYNTISKLPNYKGIVYRKVYLTDIELELYLDAFNNQTVIKEYPFISTSKFITVGILWNGTTRFTPNCLFVIYSKTGKDIELMSKYPGEKEVVLKPNTEFNVLNLDKEDSFIKITMEEQL